MLKNYLKIAYHNLRRQKGYSFLNITGLAVGIACCLLIFLFVRSELGVNAIFHDADRIYRVDSKWQEKGAGLPFTTLAAASTKMKEVYPEVIARTRIYAIDVPVEANNRTFGAEAFLVDSSAVTLFGIPLLYGNPSTALDQPRSVVMREDLARTLFGNVDVVGRPLRVQTWQNGEQTYTITGVWRKLPNNSVTQIFDLQNQLLLTQSSEDFLADPGWTSWFSPNIIHFVKVKRATDAKGLQAKLDHFIEQYAPDAFHGELALKLNPLRTLYLTAENNRGWRTIGLLSALGVLILLIAIVNFANLTTARSHTRAREVGVRKSVGAQRGQVMGQFFGEALLVSVAATCLGAAIAGLSLDAFMTVTGKEFVATHVWDGWTLLGLVGIALITGLAAGAYPAVVLSSFDPTTALSGTPALGSSSSRLRKGLVVGQFAVAVVLLIGVAVIYQQMDYMLEKDLGFQQEDVLVLDSLPREFNEEGLAQMETVKAALNRLPNVQDVSLSMYLPGARSRQGGSGNAVNVRVPEWSAGQSRGLERMLVDDDFSETYDLSLAEGRFFSDERPLDSTSVVINEAAVQTLALQDPVGTTLIGPFDRRFRIVGVVENFHTGSLHTAFQPLMLTPVRGGIWFKYLSLRISSGSDVTAVVSRVRETWGKVLPDAPFSYTFISERVEDAYRPELQVRQIVGLSAGLAIFIACLGLIGLAAFMAERRTKEIGIRKVLGASVSGIVALLSKDFLKLVFIALLVAAPVAYVVMQRWLQDFAYRVNLGPLLFIGAGLAALLIALAAVSYQALRAALADPVKAIRSE